MTNALDHSKQLPNNKNIFKQIALIFNQRAKTYLSQPHPVLREAAKRMHERLGYIKLTPANLLDAGCGAGSDIKLLQQKYLGADVFGTDISIDMLKTALNSQTNAQAVSKHLLSPKSWFRSRAQHNLNFIQSNFAVLPFACDCFDLIWSNLALHWYINPNQDFDFHSRSDSHPHPHLITAISEWHRVLKQDGLIMFSAFGPDTLIELRNLPIDFEKIQISETKFLEPAINFIDMHDYGDMLVASGFDNVVMDRDTITMTYDDVETYLNDIELLAVHTKFCAQLNNFNNHFENLENHRQVLKVALLRQLNNNPNGLSLTFEIVYGHAFKGKSRKQKLIENSVVRVEDIAQR